MFAGASPATGTAPVPVSGTVCGLPVALSATLTFALFAPVVVGANFTPTLQLALAAKLLAPKGQAAPLVGAPSVNCVGSVPVSVMLVILSCALPLLVIVRSVVALEVPTFWFPNGIFAGLSDTAAPPVAGLLRTQCADFRERCRRYSGWRLAFRWPTV